MGRRRFWGTVIATLSLDQLSKVLVKLHLPLGYELPLLGRWLKIHFVENPGAAFGLSLAGLFPDEGPMGFWPRLLLTFFALAVSVGIGYYLWRLASQEAAYALPGGLILGGAIGNLIDRIFYGVLFASINDYDGGWFQGHVVDFIYVDIWQGYVPSWVPIWGGEYMALWPIFNIADSAITIGVIWLLFLQLRTAKSS
jgi:signal peptidase II